MVRLWKWWLEGSEKTSEVTWLAFQSDHWMWLTHCREAETEFRSCHIHPDVTQLDFELNAH